MTDKKSKQFIDELKNNPEIRECLLYCYNCHEKYPWDKDAYSYWSFVNWKDVELQRSLFIDTPVPVTFCAHCGKREARVHKVKPKDTSPLADRQERNEKLKERQQLTDKAWSDKIDENKQDYARIHGKDALKTDFLQPYLPDGEPNLDYAKAYPEQISSQYTQKDIKKLAKQDISISKFAKQVGKEEESNE